MKEFVAEFITSFLASVLAFAVAVWVLGCEARRAIREVREELFGSKDSEITANQTTSS